MVELNEEARSYLISDDAVRAMRAQYETPTIASTISAVDYGLPLVVNGLQRRAEDSAGIVNLLNLVRSLDTSQLGNSAMWSRASHRSDMASDLLEILFRDEFGQTAHQTIVHKLGERARITAESASGILGSCVWVMLAVLVNRYSRSLDRQTLLRVAEQERMALSDQGWDPWIRSIEWERSASSGTQTVYTGTRPSVRPDLASASGDRAGRYPPPVSRGDRGEGKTQPLTAEPSTSRGVDGGPGYGRGEAGYVASGRGPAPLDYGQPRGGDYGDGRGGGSRHRPMVQPQPMARHTRPRPPVPEPETRRWPVFVAVAALLLIGGGAWWLLGQDRNTSDTEAADVNSNDGVGDVPGDAVDDTTPEAEVEVTADEPGVDDVDSPSYTGIVTMEIPMKDIFTFDGTQGSGTVNITIDATTGEACASVTTANVSGPYNSHIHLGSYPERGPVVVDFQPMSDGVEQCTANDIDDINEVLADRTEYYAEMHDVNGEFTVRGQLSEATLYDDLRDPNLIPDASSGTADFDTDPSANGAVVRFQGSSLLAQGVVADQTTLDALISALEASGVAVVNELRVEPSAPLPSGLFIANDGLTFGPGQDQLEGDNTAVLQTMAAVIAANPTWKLTVVGHTDDTGDRALNLELSRGRALSVRGALEEVGVPTDVLKVAGFGPDQPVGDNTTAAGRQRNRRIEFIIDPT